MMAVPVEGLGLRGLMVPGADTVDRIAAIHRRNRNSVTERPSSLTAYIKPSIILYSSGITSIPGLIRNLDRPRVK